jgi:hypothetical protein
VPVAAKRFVRAYSRSADATGCPATILRTHPDPTVYLDMKSAAESDGVVLYTTKESLHTSAFRTFPRKSCNLRTWRCGSKNRRNREFETCGRDSFLGARAEHCRRAQRHADQTSGQIDVRKSRVIENRVSRSQCGPGPSSGFGRKNSAGILESRIFNLCGGRCQCSTPAISGADGTRLYP